MVKALKLDLRTNSALTPGFPLHAASESGRGGVSSNQLGRGGVGAGAQLEGDKETVGMKEACICA